jgi:hypothetical protein
MISIQLIICRQSTKRTRDPALYIILDNFQSLKLSAKLDTIVVFVTTNTNLLRQQSQHRIVEIGEHV